MSKMNLRLTHIEAFADGSGAPALIECGSLVFAFETVGSVKCRRIDASNVRRTWRDAVQKAAEALYVRERNLLIDREWLKANARMYAEAEAG